MPVADLYPLGELVAAEGQPVLAGVDPAVHEHVGVGAGAVAAGARAAAVRPPDVLLRHLTESKGQPGQQGSAGSTGV